MTEHKALVSIVIPVFNEESGIEQTIAVVTKEMAALDVDHELILVDDGSRDNTFEVLKRLSASYPSLKAVKFSRNFGKEAAVLAGLKAATGDATITMDADLQHPPALIPKMIEQWRAGFAVVHAVKEKREHDPVWVRWRAAVYNRIFTLLGGIGLENSSDFILLDRSARLAICEEMPERMRFYRGMSRWVGFRQTSLNFVVAERWDQTGSRWSFTALLKFAGDSLIAFTTIPLRIVTFFGVMTLFIGLVVGLDATISYFRNAAVSGFATTIGVMLLLGSFIMISLGIIGEYIAKIYQEVKGRPVSLVEESFGLRQGSEKTEAP